MKNEDVYIITDFMVALVMIGAVKSGGKNRLSLSKLERYWREYELKRKSEEIS